MKFHQDPQELSIWIFKYCLIFIPLIYNGGEKGFLILANCFTSAAASPGVSSSWIIF